jgi:hypothetical protein
LNSALQRVTALPGDLDIPACRKKRIDEISRSEVHFQSDSIRRYRKARRLKVFINAVGACRDAKPE